MYLSRNETWCDSWPSESDNAGTISLWVTPHCDTNCCAEIHHLLKHCNCRLTLRMEESSRSFTRDGGTPDSLMCITSHLSFPRHNWTTATFPDASPDYESRRIWDKEKNQREVFSMFCRNVIWSCTICTCGQQPQVSNDPLPTVVISPFTKLCRFVLHSCISRNFVWFMSNNCFYWRHYVLTSEIKILHWFFDSNQLYQTKGQKERQTSLERGFPFHVKTHWNLPWWAQSLCCNYLPNLMYTCINLCLCLAVC